MSRIPDFKRIVKEDFPAEYRNLIERLAFPINSQFEQIRNAFNGNINFQNLAQELRTVEFTTNASGQPINSISFRSNLNDRVQGILVVRTEIISNNTAFPENLPVINWSQNGNIVNITNIGGLEPSLEYRLTLLTL